MATTRPVRIPRSRPTDPAAPSATGPVTSVRGAGAPERRVNTAGSQRVVRLTVLYLVVLGVLYVAFALYGRSAPGESSSAATNGLLFLSGVFALFAVVGVVLTLSPAPRWLEITPDHVMVEGRWGRRRELPPLSQLTVRVARRYSPGWLSSDPAAQVEVWGADTPVRSYLVSEDLFDGAVSSPRSR